MSLTVSELFCYCSLLGEVVLRCINKTRSVNIERSYKNRRYDTAFKLNLRHSYSALLKVSEHRHKNIAIVVQIWKDWEKSWKDDSIKYSLLK